MIFFNKLILNISSLKFAIFLLLFIAFSSSLGTLIPQGKSIEEYLDVYNTNPIFGFLDGNKILTLELDHVYTSLWFLFALFLLCISLATSSFRKQLPTLKAALIWIDYEEKEKFNKLELSCKWDIKENHKWISNAYNLLQKEGWKILMQDNRISARKGVLGRAGPILVHTGLIILLLGSAYGNFTRNSIEEYLSPNQDIELINDVSNQKYNLKLKNFYIEREDDGLPKQFSSNLEISPNNLSKGITKEAKVNHPLRYKGLTIYQADWSISNIVVKIDQLKYQFNLKPIPEVGEQIWGILIELGKDNKNKYLLTIDNENGPVKIYDVETFEETDLYLNDNSIKINSSNLELLEITPSSGLIIKSDPSIPFIYFSFILILIGATLSLIPTKRLWLLDDKDSGMLYMGGICNKNLSGFEIEFNKLSEQIQNC